MQVRAGGTRAPDRIRLGLGICLVLVVAAACGEQSNLDPDASVQVSGVVQDVGGGPLEDRPVRLGSGVSLSEGGVAFLSVGLFCLTGECAGDSFDTTTADDGSFSFDLTGRDAQSAFGETVSFLLSTSAAPAGDHPVGPAIAARFDIQTTALELPALRLVDPEPRLRSSGTDVAVEWAGNVAPGPYVAGFSDRHGLPVWAAEAAEPRAVLDGRVLEDVTGILTVSGTKEDAVEGSDLTIDWRSSATAFRGGHGAPPSRGATCAVVAADGSAETLDECRLTDGSFERADATPFVCPPPAGTSSTSACPAATAVRIQLAEPVPADLVVVRGCAESCLVSVIAPGAPARADVGPVTEPYGTVALDGSPVAAVDVVTDDVSSLGEVSVWSPVADKPALLPLEDGQVFDVDDDDGWPVAAVVVAAVAILVTGLALGVVVGRRSRAQGA